MDGPLIPILFQNILISFFCKQVVHITGSWQINKEWVLKEGMLREPNRPKRELWAVVYVTVQGLTSGFQGLHSWFLLSSCCLFEFILLGSEARCPLYRLVFNMGVESSFLGMNPGLFIAPGTLVLWKGRPPRDTYKRAFLSSFPCWD